MGNEPCSGFQGLLLLKSVVACIQTLLLYLLLRTNKNNKKLTYFACIAPTATQIVYYVLNYKLASNIFLSVVSWNSGCGNNCGGWISQWEYMIKYYQQVTMSSRNLWNVNVLHVQSIKALLEFSVNQIEPIITINHLIIEKKDVLPSSSFCHTT